MIDIPVHNPIPVDYIVFKEPVTAGMDVFVLMTLAGIYRKTNDYVEPITVSRLKGTSLYSLIDGRHRVVASMIAGRKTIQAIIVEPSEQSC